MQSPWDDTFALAWAAYLDGTTPVGARSRLVAHLGSTKCSPHASQPFHFGQPAAAVAGPFRGSGGNGSRTSPQPPRARSRSTDLHRRNGRVLAVSQHPSWTVPYVTSPGAPAAVGNSSHVSHAVCVYIDNTRCRTHAKPCLQR